MVTNCSLCGKPLTKRQKACKQKYCSTECYNGLRQKKYTDMSCLICGKIIPEEKIRKSLGTIQYCSRECYAASLVKYDTDKHCKECGKLLKRRQIAKGSDYCSRECKSTYINKNKSAGICEACGKPFDRTLRRQSKYCSEECRKNCKAYIARNKKISFSKQGKPRSVDTIRKVRIARIKQIGDANLFGGQAYPCYNRQACSFFEALNKALGVQGKHAENGGEYRDKELGYWYDYYCSELKVIIEWDEEKHFSGTEYRKKDLTRNETIKKMKPDYLLIRIRQKSSITLDEVVNEIKTFALQTNRRVR